MVATGAPLRTTHVTATVYGAGRAIGRLHRTTARSFTITEQDLIRAGAQKQGQAHTPSPQSDNSKSGSAATTPKPTTPQNASKNNTTSVQSQSTTASVGSTGYYRDFYSPGTKLQEKMIQGGTLPWHELKKQQDAFYRETTPQGAAVSKSRPSQTSPDQYRILKDTLSNPGKQPAQPQTPPIQRATRQQISQTMTTLEEARSLSRRGYYHDAVSKLQTVPPETLSIMPTEVRQQFARSNEIITGLRDTSVFEFGNSKIGFKRFSTLQEAEKYAEEYHKKHPVRFGDMPTIISTTQRDSN
jgi:hypothetical protein